jgi:Spy/CpxP family protein refolding chaperone
MKLVRVVVLSLVAGSSVVLGACGGTVETPTQTSASAVKAPVAEQSHGVLKIVGTALGEVALRPDQRTEIEKLAADADARHVPLTGERRDLMLAFADQVERGVVDPTALAPKIDQLKADFEKIRPADRAAIARLHDLLDGDQRSSFVSALEAQMQAKRGGAGFHELKQLADDLKLTGAQRDQIRDAMRGARGELHGEGHAWGPGAGHGKEALEAFRQDKLDLDKALPARDVDEIARRATDRVTSFAGKILPILTPDQRKIAADKIRALASEDVSLLGP